MKQLILVRHGEPEMDGADAAHDPGLSPLGLRQAQWAADALSAEPIDAIVTSPLQRARQTAQPLAEMLGLNTIVSAGMAEVDQDGAQYFSVEQWRAQNGEQWRAFLANPVETLGGDHAAFVARVHDALRELLRLPGKRIAVFTHGLPINVALAQALGEGSLSRFGPRHASITRMAGTGLDNLRVLSFNEATHITAVRP